jgi:hypothetical protein
LSYGAKKGRKKEASSTKVEAQELLADIYGWFTEGFGTKDLQEAKVLLAELT